jgi:hypothetical protein
MAIKIIIKSTKMNCIICQDIGSEPLKDNSVCSCKFKYHSSCWIDYVHSGTKTKCPVCRSEFKNIIKNKQSTKTSKESNTMPYTIQPSAPPPPSVGIHISYQEFHDTVVQSTNSYQQSNRISEQTSQNNNDLKLSKSFKLLLCSLILTIIVVVVILA